MGAYKRMCFFFVNSQNKMISVMLVLLKENCRKRCVKVSCHDKADKYNSFSEQGPVVQSIVRLTSSLRGQLVKCFKT